MAPAYAQNTTSPYSRLGIGDIDHSDYGKYFGSGSSAISKRDVHAFNYSNPASLTSLPYKTMHFDVSAMGRISSFNLPDSGGKPSVVSRDFLVKQISLAFKSGNNSGFAIGLRPFSTVNYHQVTSEQILDYNTDLKKQIEGIGGINQFYFSYGNSITPKISIGFSASWLFGTIEQKTTYTSNRFNLSLYKLEQDFYTGGQFTMGIQYHSALNKKWQHTLGIVSSISTGLSGQLLTTYMDNDQELTKKVTTNQNFKLPLSLGLGYALSIRERLKISVETRYFHWIKQKLSMPNTFTAPSFKIATGLEYSFMEKEAMGSYEKGFVSFGMNVQNAYFLLNNMQLWNYAITMGFGKNISRHLTIYSGLAFGKRGQTNLLQIQEKYTQFNTGVILKDIWAGPRFKKYD
jgi:hypothetical protein